MSTSEKVTPQTVDGGWGWVIVFSAGLVQSTSAGFQRAESLMYNELLLRFGRSDTETALVSSLAGSFMQLTGPLVAMMCNYFGHKKVAISAGFLVGIGNILAAYAPSLWAVVIGYGLIQSLGSGMFLMAHFSVINMYFEKNKAKANAISTSSWSIGALYMPYIIAELFHQYGYSGGMLIYAAIVLHFVPAGMLFRPVSNGKHDHMVNSSNITAKEEASASQGRDLEETCTSSHESDRPRVKIHQRLLQVSGLSLLKRPLFITLCLYMFGVAYSISTARSLLASLFLEKKISLNVMVLMISISSIVLLIVRNAVGALFDVSCVKQYRALLWPMFGLMSAVCCFSLGFSHNTYAVILLYAFWYMGLDVSYSQHLTIASDLFGKDNISSMVGLIRFTMGIGSLIGPIIGGGIKDYTGFYKYSFIVSGAWLAVCFLLYFTSALFLTRRTK